MKPLRPPDRQRAGPVAGEPARENDQLGRRVDRKRSWSRGEFQGHGNARPSAQPAPTWPRPKGSAAADALEAAFVGVTRSFHVMCRKASGREVLFGRYESRDEAEAAAKLLRWAGSVAVVVERGKCAMNASNGGER